jgi:hypothetical protein
MKLTLTYFSSQGGKILKKLIMTCNLIVVISMLAVINISASVHSENRKISIKADDMQLRDLFREIENNSEYAFFYSEQYSELDRKISMDITEGNINTIMSKLLDNTNLDYQILDNNFVVIKPKTTQQENVVNGKVVDADGNSLPGVKVLIKGTDKGAITDGDGNYSIAISDPAAILVFSSIGFNEEEMAVGAQTVINLTMVEILDELSEVVVIGYGYQRKEAVTGSVGSIGGDEIREVPSSDMTSALQGRVAGVEMMQTNSKPGSTMQIRIRGTRSLNADNDPRTGWYSLFRVNQ